MSASSDDVFYSAPDSRPPNPNSSQDQQQPLFTHPKPNLHSRSDQNQPPDKWFLRVASSAGKVISSVLGLSDGSGSDDESEVDVADMLSLAEEKDEFVKRIKELKQGRALSQVEEPKTIMPLTRSDVTVEELVTQETLSRKQSEKQINAVKSEVVESSSPFVHPRDVSSHNQLVQLSVSPVQASLEDYSVAVAKAKKWSGKNKGTSSSFPLPLNPNTSPSPCQTQQLPLASTKPPLNPDPNHCLSPGQTQQLPSSNITTPVNPLPFSCPGQNQQQPLSNIIPPVNAVPSPSLSLNRQHSAPLLSPNAKISCTNQKQSSSRLSAVMSHPERRSKPCSKSDQPGPKCWLTSSEHKEVLKKKETPALNIDPIDEEGSGDKKLPSNLKEVIELFSGDLDYEQLADMDLLDVLEMKGIAFEDPPWWPK